MHGLIIFKMGVVITHASDMLLSELRGVRTHSKADTDRCKRLYTDGHGLITNSRMQKVLQICIFLSLSRVECTFLQVLRCPSLGLHSVKEQRLPLPCCLLPLGQQLCHCWCWALSRKLHGQTWCGPWLRRRGAAVSQGVTAL